MHPHFHKKLQKMIDRLILFPYTLTLALRHAMYDHGFILKSRPSEVPTISVGGITAGGSGKTPHTEMLLDVLSRSGRWGNSHLAVLSRGYRRKVGGFQVVPTGGSANSYGDEPVQMKGKFPPVTVAVDKSRTEGCDLLAHPEKLTTSKAGAKCRQKDFPASDLIVLDDAFQYRKLAPDCNIVLLDYDRPPRKDRLLPLGRLRDLPGRIRKADILIATKCPSFLEDYEKSEWAKRLGLSLYDPRTGRAKVHGGKDVMLFFTFINHEAPTPVFEGVGDPRYIYSKKLILVTGIANDAPLRRYLGDKYKTLHTFSFPDHHRYGAADISAILRTAKANPTAVIMTTEKDAVRLRDVPDLPPFLRERLFQVPVTVHFTVEDEKTAFCGAVEDILLRNREDTLPKVE